MPKLLGGKSMITVAVAAKSQGYSPPEMDMCHVSHKSDVYSYGVVCQVYIYYHTFVYKGLEYGVKQYNAKLHVCMRKIGLMCTIYTDLHCGPYLNFCVGCTSTRSVDSKMLAALVAKVSLVSYVRQ